MVDRRPNPASHAWNWKLPSFPAPAARLSVAVFGARFKLSRHTCHLTTFQRSKVRACCCPNGAHNFRACAAKARPRFPHCHCNLSAWGFWKGLCSSPGKHLTHLPTCPPSPPGLAWPGLSQVPFLCLACLDTSRDPPPLASFWKAIEAISYRCMCLLQRGLWGYDATCS